VAPDLLDRRGDLPRVDPEHVQLHVRGEPQQPLVPRAEHEVVERDLEAAAGQRGDAGDDLVVDLDGLQHLQHHAVGFERQRQFADEELAGHVQQAPLVADDLLETELGEGAEDHLRGCVRVGPVGGHSRACAPEQQLVRDDRTAPVVDRLPGDVYQPGGNEGHAGPDRHRRR
jgi:hypothetical protein